MAVRARRWPTRRPSRRWVTEVYGPDSEMLGYFRGSLANIQLALGEIGAAIENSRMSLAIYQRTKAAGHS